MVPKIFVDFAHTPDALENVLSSVRSHFIGSIHLIIGAGGNRDIGKKINYRKNSIEIF